MLACLRCLALIDDCNLGKYLILLIQIHCLDLAGSLSTTLYMNHKMAHDERLLYDSKWCLPTIPEEVAACVHMHL